MAAAFGRLVIYTHKTAEMVSFYQRHFGFDLVQKEGDRITELIQRDTGFSLLLHPAGARQKDGQVMVKLVFDVADVHGFCEQAAQSGLTFGKVHQADGYCFANAKDPAKNSIQVSSRAFVDR